MSKEEEKEDEVRRRGRTLCHIGAILKVFLHFAVIFRISPHAVVWDNISFQHPDTGAVRHHPVIRKCLLSNYTPVSSALKCFSLHGGGWHRNGKLLNRSKSLTGHGISPGCGDISVAS